MRQITLDRMKVISKSDNKLDKAIKVNKARKRTAIILLMILLILLFIFDLSFGSAKISFLSVVNALINPEAVSVRDRIIVWDLRFPVSIMAILVGAGLAISGMEMQTILNNPLASPYTLGISSAASFGAAIALVIGNLFLPKTVDNFTIPLFAFACSIGTSFVVYVIGKIKQDRSTIILLGIAINFLFTALNSTISYFVPDEILRGISNWSQGSLVGAAWSEILIIFIVLAVVLPILLTQSWKLTALNLGESTASALGVDVERLRSRVLVLTSLITAISVCFVGTIGFIGLVSPFVAKKIIGEDQRYFIPTSLIIGSLMLLSSNTLSKVEINSISLPVSIISSLIGIPFLICLIFQKKG